MNIYRLCMLALVLVGCSASAQTVTELLHNGPAASKFNLVIIGDGFDNNDQTTYNTFVDNTVVRDLFDESRDGAYREMLGAFNIFRVNADSAQSGITTIDSTGKVISAVTTFLDYRYSGDWHRCWMEPGPNSNATLANTLNRLVPGWTHVIIILNVASQGGCKRSENQLAITTNGTWTVLAHEMGHMIGGLGDEYSNPPTPTKYTGVEPKAVNLTINTNLATLKWHQFVNPNTPVPTTVGFGGDPVADVGLFEGATINNTRYDSGIFRPSFNSRMNSNAPEFDSIGYDQMRSQASTRHDIRFKNVYTGRFTGRAGADVVVHHENSLYLYTGEWDTLAPTWVGTKPDPVWDAYRPGDHFLAGDFDGDGKQDLFVYNFTDWSKPYFGMLRATGKGFVGVRRFDGDLPGWGAMRPHDRFYVMDVDGDGKDDIVVFNGDDWPVGYLLLLRSTGRDLKFVRRYDDKLPGWDSMRRGDRFYVADFDGDGRKDLYVSNQTDWQVGCLMMLRSNGRDFSPVRLFEQTLPGWDDMQPGDQFFVADFDGDRRDDLYVFNGVDWRTPYLAMLRSTGSGLTAVRTFEQSVPGWGEMRRHDQWLVADANGDRRADLYVYNSEDWNTEYLGTLLSSGSSLNGSFQSDWIGSWNLGRGDHLAVANFNGGQGWDDLLVYNDGWFGLLRSTKSRVALTAIYPKWVHNHNYQEDGWW